MRHQLKVIQEQLDSLKWEAHNGGLDNAPFEYYPVLDAAIKNIQGDVSNLSSIVSDLEKKSKRHCKKRKRK